MRKLVVMPDIFRSYSFPQYGYLLCELAFNILFLRPHRLHILCQIWNADLHINEEGKITGTLPSLPVAIPGVCIFFIKKLIQSVKTATARHGYSDGKAWI